MRTIISITLIIVAASLLTAQTKNPTKTVDTHNMNNDILRKIELSKFNNELAFEMATTILKLARERNQNIALEIGRLNHSIFLFIGDGLSADKHNWLRRKANVTRHFEESSLAIKYDLANGKMTLDKTFALDKIEYLAKGGSIPIFVKDVGMVAIVTVSGLSDEEDHKIIVDALSGKYF
ncbi:MAG: heme-binding protein [Aureispira sp.]